MKNREGFTITELMICFGILALIAGPLYMVLSESSKKANLTEANTYIRQEGNRAFKLLENDLTQARRGTFKGTSEAIDQVHGPFSKFEFYVRKDQSNDAKIEYVYEKPFLKRYFDGSTNPYIIRNVDDFEVELIRDNPGKTVTRLLMKSDLPGFNDKDQPTYNQQKVIVMKEDAMSEHDPYWREVDDIDKFFKIEGDLIGGLTDDAKKIVQDFSAIWSKALGDIENMTLGELKKVKENLEKSLNDVKVNLADINSQIKDLEWEALYDRSGLIGGLFGANKRKRKSADKIKELVAGYKTKEEMSWEQVKRTARSDMKEEAIKAMFEAKVQLFDGEANILDNMSKVDEEMKKHASEE